ncbi:MAG TPA: amidohydrolase family protein [Candidatus Limnocylindrales bacterium]|nr:amidohydrolase family protein [Candidatus Limnocylindrales bacterium]
MDILDAHHHLWDPTRFRYPLFDGNPVLNRPYLARDYEAVATPLGIRRSICVETATAGAPGIEELRWHLGAVEQSRVVAGIVAWAPVESSELPAYLDEVTRVGKGRVKGIRRSFEFDPTDFPSRPEVISGVQGLAQRGWPFDLVLFRDSLPAATELVRRCPQVQFVLDHLGKPGIRDRELDPWRADLRALASLPNVVCKVSGLTTEADRASWTVDDLRPYFEHAVECFGWDRLLFGSDWPVCDLAGGYERWLEALDALLIGASGAVRDRFFRENAAHIYSLGP